MQLKPFGFAGGGAVRRRGPGSERGDEGGGTGAPPAGAWAAARSPPALRLVVDGLLAPCAVWKPHRAL